MSLKRQYVEQTGYTGKSVWSSPSLTIRAGEVPGKLYDDELGIELKDYFVAIKFIPSLMKKDPKLKKISAWVAAAITALGIGVGAALGQDTKICALTNAASAVGTREVAVADCGGASNERVSIAEIWAGHTHAIVGGDHTTSGGTEGNVLRQTGATTFEWGEVTLRSHATDCTLITDGEAGEWCLDLDDERIWTCQPTTGLCDTAGEWVPPKINETQIIFPANDGSRHDHVEADIADLAHTIDTDDQDATEVAFTPDLGTEWTDPDPTTVDEALENLAPRVTANDAKTVFTPNADPGVDHSSYVAGHSDGANCSAGNYPLGVDAAGVVQSCTPDDAGTDDQTAAEVTFTPDLGTEWTDPDPTEVDAALENLAPRVTANDAKVTFPGFSTLDSDYSTETVTSAWSITGSWDFGGGSFEVPNSATLPGTCTVGQLYWDTTGDTNGTLYGCRATNTWKDVDDDGGAGGFVSFDITDTDASPILTVDSLEQIQFIGAGTITVTAAADASNHDVTISGSAHDGFGYDEILDEASGLTKRAQLNFIGAGVTCVDNAGSTRTDCTISGGGGGGAFTAAGSTEIDPTSAINLTHATNNEVALELPYTVNKAAGNSTGFLLNFATDTASPGTDLLADFQYVSSSVFSIGTNTASFLDGTAANPGLSLLGDLDTGFFSDFGDTLQISLGGTERWRVDLNSGIHSIITGGPSIDHAACTAAEPCFSYWDDRDSGLSRPAADQQTIYAGGSNLFHLYGDGSDQLADFNGQTITTASTQDYGIKFTQTLNDTVAGTTEEYAGLIIDLTATDLTGWTGGAYFARFSQGATDYFRVDVADGDTTLAAGADLCWGTTCILEGSGNLDLGAWASVHIEAIRMDGGNTEIGIQTTSAVDLVFFEDDGDIRLEGDTDDAFQTTLRPVDPTAANVVSIPNATGTIVLHDLAQTLTNKTLTTPTIGDFTNATHGHTNAAGGGTIGEAALAAEDYGDWSCGAGADDCLLDSGVVDSTAIADGGVSEVDMGTEDFGDFSCAGGADDCLLDSAVVDAAAADPVLDTHTITISILDPTTSNNDRSAFVCDGDNGCTITKVWGSTDTGSCTINFEERAETTPNTAGTDVLSAGLVIDSNSQSSCASGCDVNTITNGAIDRYDPIRLMVDAVTSTPGECNIHVEYTVTD